MARGRREAAEIVGRGHGLQGQGDAGAFVRQTRQHISSLLQEAQTQAALVLDRLEARQQ